MIDYINLIKENPYNIQMLPKSDLNFDIVNLAININSKTINNIPKIFLTKEMYLKDMLIKFYEF